MAQFSSVENAAFKSNEFLRRLLKGFQDVQLHWHGSLVSDSLKAINQTHKWYSVIVGVKNIAPINIKPGYISWPSA